MGNTKVRLIESKAVIMIQRAWRRTALDHTLENSTRSVGRWMHTAPDVHRAKSGLGRRSSMTNRDLKARGRAGGVRGSSKPARAGAYPLHRVPTNKVRPMLSDESVAEEPHGEDAVASI